MIIITKPTKLRTMKKVLIVILFFIHIHLFAQNIIWERKVPGRYSDFLADAVPTLDYGFLLAGSSLSEVSQKATQKGTYNYMLAKFSETGDLEQINYFGGAGTDQLQCIINANDGGYLLAGISTSGLSETKTVPHIGGFDIWLIKLGITGGIQWQKTLGGLANEKVAKIIRTNDGGYVIAASSASDELIPSGKVLASNDVITKQDDNFGNLDYWLIKLDADGNFQWQKSFGGNRIDELTQIVELNNGALLLAGQSNSNNTGNKTITGKGQRDWWLIKTDKNGNMIWQKSFGDDADDSLNGILMTKDGHILLGGHYTFIDKNTKRNNTNIVLRKIDTDGHLIWKNTYDFKIKDILTNIIQNDDGSIVMGAYCGTHKKLSNDDFFLIKTDAEGNTLWQKKVGSLRKDVLQKIIETRDGGYVLVGSQMTTTGKGDANSDYYLVKIGDKDKPLHEKLPLEAVPNPVLTYTKVVIGKEYEKGYLRVVDLNGKILQTMQLSGNRIIPVNLQSYPASIYIINVIADKTQNSVKILKKEH